jgi:hypothetical protein
MDAAFLIVTYIVITMIFQTIGFAISRAVDYQLPGVAGLFTFLLMFIGSFYLAWPVAVRVFDRLWGDRPRRGEDAETRTARQAGKPLEYQKSLDRRPTA